MSAETNTKVVGHGQQGCWTTKTLTDKGYPVNVWDEEGEASFERYTWMKPYTGEVKPTLDTGKRINCADYDFVFLAVSMEGLREVVRKLDNLQKHTTVVVMQKGIIDDLTIRDPSPYYLVKSLLHDNPVVSFTGAGMGEHAVNGQLIRMVAAAESMPADQLAIRSAQRIVEMFADTNIITDLSYNPKVMWAGGVCRTVYSIISAVVAAILRDEEGTLATARGGINKEFWQAVALLSGRTALERLPYDSVEQAVIDADRYLCDFSSHSLSRNTMLGERLARGESPAEAYQAVRKKRGAVEGYDNTGPVFNRIASIVDANTDSNTRAKIHNFPYLYALYSLLVCDFDVKRCEEYLYDHTRRSDRS